MSKPAIFGLVQNESQARKAVAALEAAGFIATDISVLSNSSYFNDDSVEKGGFGTTREVAHTNSTKAPEGATAGAAAGGVLGGVAGWLVSIGALAIPGAGTFHCRRPDLCRAQRCGCRCHGRWNGRSLDRLRHS